MAASNIAFENVPPGDSVIAEQKSIKIFVQVRSDTFRQSVYIVLIIIIRLNSCESERIPVSLMNLFHVFNRGFITTHCVVWIQRH